MPRLPLILTLVAGLTLPALADDPNPIAPAPSSPEKAPEPSSLAKPAVPAPAPAKPATPTPESLAGPKVTKDDRPTLLRKDVRGKVVRLDMPVPDAALMQLKLDDQTKAATNRVLLQRAAAMDRLVKENLGDLAALSNAMQSGNKAEAKELFTRLYSKNSVLTDRDRVIQELAAVMPKEQADQLRTMVQEYMAALIEEQAEEAKARGEKPDPKTIVRDETLRSIGQEIKAAYERVIVQGGKDFDAFLKKLDLTPEQDAKIRKLVTDAFLKQDGNLTPRQKGQIFWQVWQDLTPEQRKILQQEFKAIKGK